MGLVERQLVSQGLRRFGEGDGLPGEAAILMAVVEVLPLDVSRVMRDAVDSVEYS